MLTAALMPMKRPVVGGGIPQEGGQQSIELLDLGSLRWSVKVLLPAARTDAAMTLMSDGTMMMAGGDSPESGVSHHIVIVFITHSHSRACSRHVA